MLHDHTGTPYLHLRGALNYVSIDYDVGETLPIRLLFTMLRIVDFA